MPFLQGRGALRRTRQWLEKSKFFLRDDIKVITFSYSPGHKFPHHDGLEKFVFWHVPQLKYRNPGVQFVTFRYMTPSPWIRVYQGDDTKILIDCDSRTRQEIHDHFQMVFNKSDRELAQIATAKAARVANPANFGPSYERQCICTRPGQVSCPGFKELPKSMQGKWQHKLKVGDVTLEELEDLDRKHAQWLQDVKR